MKPENYSLVYVFVFIVNVEENLSSFRTFQSFLGNTPGVKNVILLTFIFFIFFPPFSGETVEEQRQKIQTLNIVQPATNVIVQPFKVSFCSWTVTHVCSFLIHWLLLRLCRFVYKCSVCVEYIIATVTLYYREQFSINKLLSMHIRILGVP